ncbi:MULTISPECIES: UPF0715 family protein [Pontibacillus]|uniref:UPF0715 family protein n=1 Tax=Pontibacillus chungwhensis TaxID=265426 RepID=A0ABY8UXS1_9BACI|nr:MULTISPECIES: UPF0715 family protein [Pontibacillus]MCD5325303.1 UPF0715 family protein [Pontibacillus sp. HN14]WIF97546.1 UPF0715 family protein [Pontibacillus chungwhensis]
MNKRNLVIILLAAVSMTFFYLIVELSFMADVSKGMIFAIFLVFAVFFLLYLLFALPILIYLQRKIGDRNYSLKYFLSFLVGSFLVHLLINPLLNEYQSPFVTPEWYVYVVSTALFIWLWDSAKVKVYA